MSVETIYIGIKDGLKFKFKASAVVCIDEENRRVYLQNGRPLVLSKAEFVKLMEDWGSDGE